MVNILVAKPVRKQTMRVIAADGYQASMHATPRGFVFKEVPVYGQIAREGKRALTRVVAPGLKQLSFTQTVASLDYQQSIEPIVQRFAQIGSRGMRIRFSGGSGPFEQACWWLVKDMSVTVAQRGLDNKPSFTSISWTLEEWADVTTKVVKPKPAVKKPTTVTPRAVASPTRTHKVVRGDTLWGLAQRYLGNGLRWPEIYRLNASQIRNPHWIYPGQVFKIPGR